MTITEKPVSHSKAKTKKTFPVISHSGETSLSASRSGASPYFKLTPITGKGKGITVIKWDSYRKTGPQHAPGTNLVKEWTNPPFLSFPSRNSLNSMLKSSLLLLYIVNSWGEGGGLKISTGLKNPLSLTILGGEGQEWVAPKLLVGLKTAWKNIWDVRCRSCQLLRSFLSQNMIPSVFKSFGFQFSPLSWRKGEFIF